MEKINNETPNETDKKEALMPPKNKKLFCWKPGFWKNSPRNKAGIKKYPDNQKNINDLIEEVAKRASFSRKDVDLILRTFRDVLGDWIVERTPFSWVGFFKIYYCNTPDRTYYDPVSNSMKLGKGRIYPRVKFSLIFNKLEKERLENRKNIL